tara:strand:- start:3850 stop:4197 length:348 start_codon:yes stop_codon:yes gene_type:complete
MFRFLLVICFCLLSIFPSKIAYSAEVSQSKIDKLTEKVAKKFSRTFCNTSNFGISDEGALEFAIGETKKEYAKNKSIKYLNYEDLNKKIITNIELDCQVFDFPLENLSNIKLSNE